MKNIFYLVIFGAFLYMLISAQKQAHTDAAPKPAQTPEQIAQTTEAQRIEATSSKIRIAVRGHLRSTLKDFDSLKDLRFSELQQTQQGPSLYCTFRAKNSFGAYTLNGLTATLDTNSNTVAIAPAK